MGSSSVEMVTEKYWPRKVWRIISRSGMVLMSSGSKLVALQQGRTQDFPSSGPREFRRTPIMTKIASRLKHYVFRAFIIPNYTYMESIGKSEID